MAEAAALEGLFARLDTAIKNGQAKRGLKAADEILKLSPGDADAVRCKVVLLIESGNHEEAQKLASQPPQAADLAFERAYCHYRQGKLQEALAALQEVPADKEAACLQLEAQIHYRLGSNKEAIALYSQLFRSHGGESREVQTNVLAAYVAGGRAADIPAVMQAMKISSEDSFEIAFNAACGLVEAGQLAAAEQQLQLAVRVGEEALYDEDLQEGDVALELAPVTAQLAYVADALGRPDEAAPAYEGLLRLDLDDDATSAVTTNNLYAELLRKAGSATQRKVAGDAVKKLDAFMERSGGLLRLKGSLERRLGPAQREAVLTAYAAAAMLAGKNDIAKEAVRSMEKVLPGAAVTAMLQASLLSREGKAREADAVLAPLAADPARAAEAGLIRAQLAASSGDGAAALRHLQGIADAAWQARPAVLATQVALLDALAQPQQAAAVLGSALDHWRAAPESPERAAALRWIITRLAALQLQQGALEEVSSLYRQLIRLDPTALSDPDVLSKYAHLAAVCDPAAAAELRSQLPQRGGGPSAAELDTLENANLATTAGRHKGADEPAVPVPASQKAAGAVAAAGEGEHKKRKRKRTPRYPKGFDPANPGPPPDPERWLPKWQRTESKKLRKKMRGKEATKGSQGAGKVDEQLDRSGAVDEPESKGKAPVRPPPGKGKKGKGRR